MNNSETRKTRIHVSFLFCPTIWPYAWKLRKDYIFDKLKEIETPNIEFIDGGFIKDLPELGEVEKRGDVDGLLNIILSQWHPLPWSLEEKADLSIFRKRPMIITNGVFGGIHLLLYLQKIIRKEKLPIIPIATFNFEDALEKVKSKLCLIDAIRRVKRHKVLYVGPVEKEPHPPSDNFWRLDPEQSINTLREVFGVEVIHMESEGLQRIYEGINEDMAKNVAEEFTKKAMQTVGPNEENMIKSAKLYLAIKRALRDTGTSAVSVNDYQVLDFTKAHPKLVEEFVKFEWGVKDERRKPGALEVLPCLANSLLMDENIPVGPQGDLDAIITNIVGRELTERPGWVYEPSVDPSAGELIYFHCCIPRKLCGPGGPCQSYDVVYACHYGVVPHITVPLNTSVTSVKISIKDRKFAIHQGRITGKIPKRAKMDKGEITIGEQVDVNKIVVEADAEKIFNNWNYDIFGWHRCAFMGDFREEFIELARLYGLEVIEEDK